MTTRQRPSERPVGPIASSLLLLIDSMERREGARCARALLERFLDDEGCERPGDEVPRAPLEPSRP